MIMVAFTCTKDEGPDCHKRITVKNASEIPLYVVNELIYNWTSVPTYPEICFARYFGYGYEKAIPSSSFNNR